jgi:hypothetical protein
MCYVYFIQQGRGSIKIGVSEDPDRRLKELQTGTSRQLRLIAKLCLPNRAAAFDLEKELHIAYGYLRGSGEWFKPAILRQMRMNLGDGRGKRRLIGGTHKNPITIPEMAIDG